MSEPRASVLVDGAGIAIGFRGRHGAALVELESARALVPTRALHLGDAPTDGAPSIARMGGSLVAAWVDLDGAHVAPIGRPSIQLDDATHAIDLAVVGRELWVAIAGDALVLHRLDVSLAQCAPARVLLDRRDVRALRVVESGGDVLVLHGLADPVLAVHRVTTSESELVRHALDAPIVDLVAASVPGTVALGIDDGRGALRFATLDRRGRMKERPHRVGRGHRTAPAVCWIEDGFALGSLEVEHGRYELTRSDGTPILARDGIPLAPWIARYHDRKLLLFRVLREGDQDRLELHTVRGGEAQRHEIPITPTDSAERARRARMKTELRRVLQLAPSVGYRGGVRAQRVGELATEVRFESSPARVELAPRGPELELRLRAGRTALPEIPDAPTGLRAFFRRRRRAAWAEALVGDSVVECARDTEHAWVRMRVVEVPEAAQVLAWLRALVEMVRDETE